ncbi:MAG: hypothetical protein RML72_08435 [Bacteroidia bacterium]|nr:hypothetical protein [Bacteroidia bacterium]MDW8158882.1 hypothetical protein [Bacteroidia bacterium]
MFRVLLPALFLFLECNGVKKKNILQNVSSRQDTVLKKEVAYNRYWNDLARYLGGLPPKEGSVLDSVEYRPDAIAHRDFFEKNWSVKDSILLKKLSRWSKIELEQERKRAHTVLYPFSGPDFVTIHTLFPDASRYVMFGLELEGKVPKPSSLPPAELSQNLKNLAFSLDAIFNKSFFFTLNMSADLYRTSFRGVLPILLAFVSRCNNEVLEVKHFKINSQGRIEYYPDSVNFVQQTRDTIITGVEILFRSLEKPSAPIQTLHFLCFDASNGYYKSRPELDAFFLSLEPAYTYIKAASYLLHGYDFELIRNRLISISAMILQDDTGIPYRMFDPQQWKIQLYGKYTTPIPIFASKYQLDLDRAYASDTTIRPVDFGLGYKAGWGPTNLLKATRLKKQSLTPEKKLLN